MKVTAVVFGVAVSDWHIKRRRHVARAVLDIEPARHLDLLHLLARRHGDAEELLDQLVFLHRRRDEIDPHRVLGRLRAGLDRHALEHSVAGHVDRKHAVTIEQR